MKKVITYGTFDLFHEGHLNILKRAKELGDYLIVGITSENYDKSRGKLNVIQSLSERIENVRKTGLADLIIVEEYEGQKIDDIQRYRVDLFVIGSDWRGKFDYLKEYCEVIYLDRTPGISSTELRGQKFGIIKLGIVGCGRIAERFVPESKYVSGINVEGVYDLDKTKAKEFVKKYDLLYVADTYDDLLKRSDAIYIAAPHNTHFEYARKALENYRHVLCEKPITLTVKEVNYLYRLAKKQRCVLLEGIKTAYCPGFLRLCSIAKSGAIGHIKSVDATFTKLIKDKICREYDPSQEGGSVTELASYPLLVVAKLLGSNIIGYKFYSLFDREKRVDIFTKIILHYKNAVAILNVGIGIKSEGELIISGTEGYIYVPAPWWKTEYFEVRGEHLAENKRYVERFEAEGLRYEIAEFVRLINLNELETYKLNKKDSLFIINIIEKFKKKKNIEILE
jgi:choline-phosphate cytidylyltransferase